MPRTPAESRVRAVLSGAGPLVGFAVAADAAVAELSRLVPRMDLWLVTRVVRDRQVVVARAGRWADIAPPGAQFAWQATFCVHMVTGQGPPLAPCVADVPAYRQVAVGPLAKVKAYLGVPLVLDDGELFGTVCAYAGATQPDALAESMPTVTLLARMLSTVLAGERHAHDRSADAAQAYALAERDPVTGLRNRRGFERLLESEQGRIRRFGTNASVLVMRLDHGVGGQVVPTQPDGETYLGRCASVLTSLAQPGDVAARIDPTELALLVVGADALGARALQVRLRRAVRTERLTASVGVATRRGGEDLADTWLRARTSAGSD